MKKKIICPECDGRGYISHVETWSDGNGVGGGRAWSELCVNCNGTGEVEVPMTNYEYIKTMDIEDIAYYLMMFCNNSEHCRSCPVERCPRSSNDTEPWIKWLKKERGD